MPISTSDSVHVRNITVDEKVSSDNGLLLSDGSGNITTAGITASGVVLLSSKKLGVAVNGDILDLSASQGVLKLGPTSTTLKLNLALTTNNMLDINANTINSGAASSFSTITATNHNYLVATPTTVLFDQQTGTATATAIGTVGATQYTPTGGVSGTYKCYTLDI